MCLTELSNSSVPISFFLLYYNGHVPHASPKHLPHQYSLLFSMAILVDLYDLTFDTNTAYTGCEHFFTNHTLQHVTYSTKRCYYPVFMVCLVAYHRKQFDLLSRSPCL